MAWLQHQPDALTALFFEALAEEQASAKLMYEQKPLICPPINSFAPSLLQSGFSYPGEQQQVCSDFGQLQALDAGLLEAAFSNLVLQCGLPRGVPSTEVDTMSSAYPAYPAYPSRSVSLGDSHVLGSHAAMSHQLLNGPSQPFGHSYNLSGLSSADPIVDFSPKPNVLAVTNSLGQEGQSVPVAFSNVNSTFAPSSTLAATRNRPIIPVATDASSDAMFQPASTSQASRMPLSPQALYSMQSLAANIQPIFTATTDSNVTDVESAFTPSSTPGRSNYNFLVWSPTMSPRTPFHDSPLPSTCKWVTPPLPPLLDKVSLNQLLDVVGHLPMDDGHWSELLKASKPEILVVLLENYLHHEDPAQWVSRAAKNPNCRAVDNPRKYLTTNLKQKRDTLTRRPEVCKLVQDLKLACPRVGKSMDGQSIQHICDHLKVPLAVQACGGYLAEMLQADSCWETGKKPKAVVLGKVKQFAAVNKDSGRSLSSGSVMEDRAHKFELLTLQASMQNRMG